MNKVSGILTALCLMCLGFSVFCQNSVQVPQVFGHPETLPQFRGSQEDLYKFIREHLEYPDNWPVDSITGKVYVEFTVDTSGNVLNPKILRGLDPALDTIAIRICTAMPKWYPARNGNKPVAYQHAITIRFGETRKLRK